MDNRLQPHCDMLNAMNWVRASRDPYVVAEGEDERQVIVRQSEMAKAKDARRDR